MAKSLSAGRNRPPAPARGGRSAESPASQEESAAILDSVVPAVKPSASRPRRGRARKRRQSHGAAWHWKQTDCWYYTPPGTRRRVGLFDEYGERIRGADQKPEAQLALARVRVAGTGSTDAPAPAGAWLVAQVCSEYLQYCQRGVQRKTLSQGHHDGASWVLNDLCKHCGAVPVSELKREHIHAWIEARPNWKSLATHRSVIAIAQAAFNYAEANHNVPNPLKGLKRPAAQPRLHSFSAAEEQQLYDATDQSFGDFLLAAIHTGLRPFSELAKLTAQDVEETARGMMWRVYASKTKKTRKIPVRPEVAALTRKLLAQSPPRSRQPLFRNSRGGAWTKVAGVQRFIAIRKELAWDGDPVRRRYSCYTCRHTFAHRMLSGYWNKGAGCSIETLAELMGDTPKVAFDHYGREWGQHYQEPLWSAIGLGAAPPESGAPSSG